MLASACARRVIAETGAGDSRRGDRGACAHCLLLVYMGGVDMERQAPNVGRMSPSAGKSSVETDDGRCGRDR